MPFKQGKVVDKFSVKGKDGEKIQTIFRYPKKSDAKACLKMINSVRREAEYLGQRRMETLKSERKWLKDRLSEMRKRKGIFLLVEIEGELIGSASVLPGTYEASDHVGTFGIVLAEKFTGFGIGTRLGKKTLELAKKETKFKLVDSTHFSKNRRSAKLHKKLGFKRYGRFPNECRLKKGGYDDSIWLYKQIKRL
jgi:RimJ/RimL family protein N-acetyltransferase